MAHRKSIDVPLQQFRRTSVVWAMALAVAFPWVVSCKREKPVVIQSEKATRRNLVETVTATGRVQPVLQVKISPEVSGEIIELLVKEGQKVKKGDVLVRIRKDFYEASRNSAEASRNSSLANLKSSEASLLTAEANLRKAMAEFKRNQDLFDRKLVSDSVFDDVRTQFETSRSQASVAKAQIEAAQHQTLVAAAALKKAEEDLLKTTILAPIDGTVSKLVSEVGERVVGTGMMAGTEIMTIADLNEMEARVEVGEVDVVRVALGQKTRLEVDSFRDQKFNGVVTQIANSARTTAAATQSEATKFEVRIRITDKLFFRPGMSVTADIETQYRTNVVAVPFQSVTSRLPKEAEDAREKASKKKPGDLKAEQDAADQLGLTDKQRKRELAKPMDVVFTVENGKARMVPVKRGISDETHYEILSGVTEGMEIVTGSYVALARDLKDGKPVKMDDKSAKSDSAK